MTFLGWCVVRGEDKVITRLGDRFSFTLLVPTVHAWRVPRYGALWGARSCDVQLGSPADRARQQVLARRARERRMQLLVMIRVRDNLTPMMQDIDRQMRALSAATMPATEALGRMAEELGKAHHERMRKIAESIR